MISVYCSEKLDGVCAAAIVFRHAVLSRLPVHFGGFLHPESFLLELEDMCSVERQLVFVLDAVIGPEHLELLDKISKKNKLVYWVASGDCVVPPVKIFDRSVERKCSSELVCERFLPNDLVAKRLAGFAHEVKFWQIRDELSSKLADVIFAGFDPVVLVDLLSRGVFWNDQLEAFCVSYRAKKVVALDELLKSLVVKSFVNVRFGFVLAPVVLSGADACQRVLDGHAGVDVAVAVFRDGRLVFRRRDNCSVDLNSLASLFGGGGREFASGAKLGRSVSFENFEEVLSLFDSVFRNYFVAKQGL